MVNCSDPAKEAERRRKIGDANRGRVCKDETKEKMSAVRKGRPHSKEHSENIGKALKGRVITPEWREKLRQARLGKKASPETKAKMSASHSGENNHFYGKTHTDTTKEKLREFGKANLPSIMRFVGGQNPTRGIEPCKHPSWKGGVSFFPYCYKFDDKRKDAARRFFGNRCICCGRHRDEIPIKGGRVRELDVHHIDHDKEQGCGGKPFNLVPLCISCHSKEQHAEDEYKKYINRVLDSGFEFGIWSRKQYEEEVMYPQK